MAIVDIYQELVRRLEHAFDRLGAEYHIVPQYNYTVDAIGFKRSGNRTYCYVLRKDKTNPRNRVNLVFRFRSGDQPKDWFRNRQVNSLAAEWCGRFSRAWSEESGTSSKFREPAAVTDQFGLRVTPDELDHAELDSTLDIFVEIATITAIVASRRQNRDWTEYEELTA